MRVAVFTKNLTNPAYSAARLGAERAARACGGDIEVLHFVPQQPDDPAEQSALIDQALALEPRPDIFVLSPVHPTRVDAAIGRVAQAGIPMVGFVNPILAAPMLSYVSSDDFQLARAISQYLFKHLGGVGRVLVVGGHAESVTSLERLRGFRDAATESPGIELTGFLVGDYDREVARQRTAAWLRENLRVDGCLVANDIMALGVIDALRAASRHAAVVGVNAIPEGVAAIQAGSLLASADFNAMKIAYLAAECAVRHLRGEHVPPRIELPVQIVDRSNCSLWDLPYEQRPILTLDELRRLA